MYTKFCQVPKANAAICPNVGWFKDFSDPTRLKVTVGNALAVNLNCGGRDSGPAGGSGKVKSFQCTAAGLKSL